MSNTCESCKHSGVILNAEKLTALVCKRYPPAASAVIVINGGVPEWRSCTVWPAITRDDVCGDYAADNPKLAMS